MKLGPIVSLSPVLPTRYNQKLAVSVVLTDPSHGIDMQSVKINRVIFSIE